MNMSDATWAIGKIKNQKLYYVSEVNRKKAVAIWTTRWSEALKFESAVYAQSYIVAWLQDRKDVHPIKSS